MPTIVRPRLTDYYDIALAQEEADFAVPFLDEDVPLYIDPFLLWKSPSLQDNSLHTAVVNAFNNLGRLHRAGKTLEATEILKTASECEEIGLGFSGTRKGLRFGDGVANEIVGLFDRIPQLSKGGFTHFEEIQLLVNNVSKDRVSDIAGSFLLSFLIDFTIDQCDKHSIPTQDVVVPYVFDYKSQRFSTDEKTLLPINPETGKPVVLVPKRWLRAHPWIGLNDYIGSYYKAQVKSDSDLPPSRVAVLNYNRQHYGMVQAYVKTKEREKTDCRNDPLFKVLPVYSVKKKYAAAVKLQSGRSDGADKKYEEAMCQLMASLLYPELDFAAEQSRTDSGVHIRDLIFYNSRSTEFLRDLHAEYDARQLVVEIKNVAKIDREHINQLNRYMSESLGRFGVILTRAPLPRAVMKNTIDLWSGQRRCIIALDDRDVGTMVTLFESKQRSPIDVVKAKYVDFIRACPS